jgi:hypothetical protein
VRQQMAYLFLEQNHESKPHRTGSKRCYEQAPELRRTLFLSTTLQRLRRPAA